VFSRYLLRRLLHSALLLTAVSAVSFVLIDIAPGDYFDEARVNPRLSPQTVAALRSEFGLDRPLAIKYGAWMWAVARGQLGLSIAYNMPVRDLIGARMLHTLMLTGPALMLSWALAIPLGLWMAARPGGFVDRAGTLATNAILAIPEVVAACLVLLLAVRTGLLPSGGMTSAGFEQFSLAQQAWDLFRHMVGPVGILVLAALPILIRHTRTAGIEASESAFLRAARALGIGEWRLFSHYVFRVAANPLASLFGLSIGGLLSASLLVEVVLGWPGLGPLFLEAISGRDVFVVLATVLCSSAVTIGGALVGDVLLYWCDPRIREL